MTLLTKNVTTLTELKTVVSQGNKAAVLYDVSTGEAYGLDLEVIINMDASISGMDASVGQVWTMAETIAQETVDAATELIEGYVADASTSSAEAIAAAAAFPTTHPETALYSRWLADTGTQFDVDLAMQAYEKMKAADPNTVFVFMPHVASKIRTSGVNRYMNKMYSLKSATYDAAQTTEATQPFVGGYIAPSEKIGLKYMAGQTQTGLIEYLDKSYASNASWALTVRFKPNTKSDSFRLKLSSSPLVNIQVTATSILLGNVATGVNIFAIPFNAECGRTYTVEFNHNNGAGYVLINGKAATCTVASSTVTFGEVSKTGGAITDAYVYYVNVQDGVKSAAQSQLDHQILSTFFPDVETIGIGYQKWTTSNFDGIVAGDGTVIPEVQGATTDGNAELSPSLDFTSGWTTASATVVDLNTFTTSGYGGVYGKISLSANKIYRVIISGTTTATLRIQPHTGTVIASSVVVATGAFSETVYVGGTASATLYVGFNTAGQLDITSLSVKEVGASDSTNVYNYVYAATSGSAAVKDIAATKAAAGWCYYNNDPANGAVYGKLYNWYAVHLFDIYTPIRGYRIPSNADCTQLIATLGGTAVAGGKMKVAGTTYFYTPNTGATNESGFSAIGGGRTDTNGAFSELKVAAQFHTSTESAATTAYRFAMFTADATSNTAASEKVAMRSLRLLANAPNVPDTSEIQTNWITTNFASGTANVDLTIPFGCVVDFVRVLSRTGITSMQGVLYTGAGVAKEPLFSGATVVADTPIELNTRVNQSIQQTNGFVRFNGVKADTGGLMMIVVGLKRAYNTEQL